MYGRNAAEFVDDLREAALEQLALSLRALQAMKSAYDPWPRPRGSERRGRDDGPERDAHGSREGRREREDGDGTDYLYSLAEAHLRYHRELLRIHSQHFEQVADRLRDVARRSWGPPRRCDGAIVREEILLERTGDEASGVFELENRTWSAIEPRFFAGTFEAGPGRATQSLDVECVPVERPREASIRPGEAVRYRVRVRLPADPLQRDGRWRGTLLAVDDSRVVAEVVLRIEDRTRVR
jgi:hypothetical protein